MGGDLKKWSTPDVPRSEDDHVKFKRKGGWFITKKLLIITAILILVLLIVAIFITKELTERQYKPEGDSASALESEHSPIIHLSEDIIPQHFELKLKPYLDVVPVGIEPFTLVGQVLIHFKVLKPTSTVTLNYAGSNINFTSAYSSNNNKSLTIKLDKYIRSLELYSVEFEENLQPTLNYSLQLIFSTSVGDEQKGFYRRKHVTGLSRNNRWMGMSHLEPAYARRMFPCFDEPRFRSTFDISVNRLKNMSALANTNRQTSVSNQENNAWIWDIFETTPPIPTHKISILIADLTVSKVDVDNTTLSIWSRTDLFNGSLNLIDITTSVLKFYHSYFTVRQPISKLDLVAVPEYLNDKSGSWGLITFSESLIYKDKNDKDGEIKFALEISKKLAEQWFGNLVSLNWWNDMWIKDSVAIYVAYVALDQVRPNYEIKSSFIADVLQKALDTESYPVSDEIHILSDIADIWLNDYTSLKGASLLHMIASLSSANHLQESINNYLEKWSEKVTTSVQFWESFSSNLEKHNINVIEFTNNWLRDGYPVVNCNYNPRKREVVIDQQPFYLQHPPSHSSVWDIPITYLTSEKIVSSETPNKIWLKHSETALKFVLHTNDSWILVNLPQRGVPGFYRVNYDLDNWISLMNELNNTNSSLQSTVKSILLDDSYQLAKAGRLPYSVPINLTKQAFEETTSYLPFNTIDAHLTFLKPFFHGKNNHEKVFKNFVKNLFMPLFQRMSPIRSSNDTFDIRGFVLKWSCQYGIPECINWANSAFKSWITNEDTTMGALKFDIAISTGIRYATKQDLETTLNRSLSNSIVPKKRLQLLKSLTSTTNSTFILELLEKTLQFNHNKESMSQFSDEDVVVIWESLPGNLDAKEDVLKFFIEHWDDIYRKYHANYKVLSAIIKGTTDSLTEERHLTDVASINERVLEGTKVPLRSLKSALNRLIVKTAWRDSKFNSVKELLQ